MTKAFGHTAPGGGHPSCAAPDFVQAVNVVAPLPICASTAPTARDLALHATQSACPERCFESSLADLWRQLATGRAYVVESLFSQAMCGALVARVENRRVALSEPRLQILEGVLSARPQKTLALEMNLAASTIAMHARLGLQTIGSSGNPSRAHPLLMLAAMTAVGAAAAAIATETLITHGASELSVLWIARPDLELDRVLTSSEAAVVRFLVEGESYAAIAAARRTSKRTVANQVAAVFKRFGVSGRNQLVARLLRGADARP